MNLENEQIPLSVHTETWGAHGSERAYRWEVGYWKHAVRHVIASGYAETQHEAEKAGEEAKAIAEANQ